MSESELLALANESFAKYHAHTQGLTFTQATFWKRILEQRVAHPGALYVKDMEIEGVSAVYLVVQKSSWASLELPSIGDLRGLFKNAKLSHKIKISGSRATTAAHLFPIRSVPAHVWSTFSASEAKDDVIDADESPDAHVLG